jgi:uncharacterized membrane protein YeaQ/YmgE (transglycosylase-associated protein family)
MIGIIVNIIIGGIIGWIASMIMKTDEQMGKIANVIVGIVGANLGFWLAGMIGLGGGTIVRYAIAVAGAAILIWILKLVGVFK